MKTHAIVFILAVSLSACGSSNTTTANNTGLEIEKGSCSTITKYTKVSDPGVTFSKISTYEYEDHFSTLDNEAGSTETYQGTMKGVYEDGTSWGVDRYQGTTRYFPSKDLNSTDYEITSETNETYTDAETGETTTSKYVRVRTWRENADGTKTLLSYVINGTSNTKTYTKKDTKIDDHTRIMEKTFNQLDQYKDADTASIVSRVETCVIKN